MKRQYVRDPSNHSQTLVKHFKNYNDSVCSSGRKGYNEARQVTSQSTASAEYVFTAY